MMTLVSGHEDYLDLTIKDLEQMVQTWSSLASSKTSCAGIKALITKKNDHHETFNKIKASNASSATFDRLIAIHSKVSQIGDGFEIQQKVVDVCLHIAEQKMRSHPALEYGPLTARNRLNTEPQVVENLAH